MHKQLKMLMLSSMIFIVGSCATTTGANNTHNTNGREMLTIPVAIYIVDNDGNQSSQRTVQSMEAHFAAVNEIWAQADIMIKPIVTERVQVPGHLLRAVSQRRGRGGIADFFRAIRRGEVSFSEQGREALIWAFYMRSLGGPNGLKPIGSNIFFVADNTSVDDARVSSHEIGHVLGLFHVHTDTDLLLYSGTDGVVLTEEEQAVARYNAKRILRYLP